DERYKQNINNLSYGLNEVMQLRPVSYQWKDKKSQLGTGTNLGFVAQELERVVPDLVIHTAVEKDAETGKLPNEYADAYGVKYAEFIPVLTKAIQEQQALIDQLQKEIEILKARQ
ncbi:MAG: tail fiber domain-containing protein, partial [Bacteroidetes bacterium]|nr:tail fiber domain-containing protein [Bacteroidota bacterium]